MYLLNACRGRFDTSFEGGAKHHRTVNQILGNMLCLHWPGLVTHPISVRKSLVLAGTCTTTSLIADISMPREPFGMAFG
jgi:hypothetical protein